MTANSSRPTTVLLISSAALGTAAILLTYCFWPSSGPSLDPSNFARLIELKNTGIANLENVPNEKGNDGSDSIAAFAEISRLLPDEPIGPRNLAIAYLMALGAVDKDEFPSQFSAAAKACGPSIQALKESEPDSGIPHILAAKLAMVVGDRESALNEYEMAINKMPGDSLLWSDVFLILVDQPTNLLRTEALQRATLEQPFNLMLLSHLVPFQAQSKDPAIVDSLANLKQVLQPMAAEFAVYNIKVNSEIDSIVDGIDEMDDAAWKKLYVQVFQLFNVVRKQYEYRRDEQRLERHALDFVVRDYSSEFYERFPNDDSVVSPASGVKFVAAFDGGSFDGIDDASDIAIFDFDLDGTNELIVLRELTIEIYALNSTSRQWKIIASTTVPAGMQQIVLADFDRDTVSDFSGKCQVSDLDVLLFGPGGHRLLENKPVETTDGRRKLVELPAPLSLDTSAAVHAATVADVEHDGDLDIILTTDGGPSIWVNLENWAFSASRHPTITLPDTSSSYTTIAAVDWNRDVLTDLLLASKSTVGRLENMRHGRFRWEPFSEKAIPQKGVQSLVVCDVDGNASWDILTSGDQGVALTLTSTRPGLNVHLTDTVVISKRPSLGVASWDYDNDGHLDIVAWSDTGIEIFRGNGDGSFADETPSIAETTKVNRCCIGDLDGDGDQDLIVISGNNIRGYFNEGGNKNHWIDIRLSAEPEEKFPVQRTNLYGTGSLVELRVGRSYQARTARGSVVHFGLGEHETADAIRVMWTNGIPQNVVVAATDQTICENQRLLKGSCPYLYTWTGDRYEFFTDLLWAAPIGLQIAEGKMMPSRSWEYLLIPGNRLSSMDGEYRIQVTEELWEAAYFDLVQLIAVDHPTDVSIFSNEKVGPPEIAKYLIHTVPTDRLRPPMAASDSRGRDVLPLVQHRDDRYVRLFEDRHKQGLIDEHFIELDLGKLDQPKSVKLVLTGWVFPTDTSINVAISQNPNLQPPQPPSVWIPDASNHETGWKQIIANMGFPGGKTKTIVVDLPVDQFTADDYRVRIVTSMELYWDAIAVAVDARVSECRQTPLRLLAADLHYRGVSAREDGKHHGPDRYDYNDVETNAVWAPMSGNFTRYGDVTAIVDTADDRLVVMAAGDEMTLSFKQIDPPPPGWRRDFILHNVGWDKDADLNTVTGFQVEPLPYRGMSEYPPGPNSIPPNSEQYREYLRIYQTRSQSAAFWNQLKNPYNRAD